MSNYREVLKIADSYDAALSDIREIKATTNLVAKYKPHSSSGLWLVVGSQTEVSAGELLDSAYICAEFQTNNECESRAFDRAITRLSYASVDIDQFSKMIEKGA